MYFVLFSSYLTFINVVTLRSHSRSSQMTIRYIIRKAKIVGLPEGKKVWESVNSSRYNTRSWRTADSAFHPFGVDKWVVGCRAGNGSRRVTHDPLTHLPSELWPMTHCPWPMTHISYSNPAIHMYYDMPECTVVSKWKRQLDNCYEIVCIDHATKYKR